MFVFNFAFLFSLLPLFAFDCVRYEIFNQTKINKQKIRYRGIREARKKSQCDYVTSHHITQITLKLKLLFGVKPYYYAFGLGKKKKHSCHVSFNFLKFNELPSANYVLFTSLSIIYLFMFFCIVGSHFAARKKSTRPCIAREQA